MINRTASYPALAPSNLDLNADTWKPVLVTNPAVFTVAAPDGHYFTRLHCRRRRNRRLSKEFDQRAKGYYQLLERRGPFYAGTKFCGNWWRNIICPPIKMRMALILFQAQPIHSPIRNSLFPIRHTQPGPTHTLALRNTMPWVTAYHFKKLYNRAPVYTNNTAVQALIPKSTLPSYPSEDAVVAGATVEILKLLFPTEVDYIQQKAAEEMQYRIMAGANVRGELTAGEALGSQVADVFAARARADNAGKAIGTAAEMGFASGQCHFTGRPVLDKPGNARKAALCCPYSAK